MAQSVPSAVAFLLFFSLFSNIACDYNLNQATDDNGHPVLGITNGEDIMFDEFPFMAALGWTKNATDLTDYLGGGILISPNFVLTAAHCAFLKGKPPSKINIGGNSLFSYSNDVYEVEEVFLHPEYNETLAYNDIALIKLSGSSRRSPVCLWKQSELTTSNFTAIGYGATQFAGLRSDRLLKVKLLAYPEKECQRYFNRQRKFRSGILHSHICAGDPEGKRDTCQGDSGGPLLVVYNNQTYSAGVTSTGQACSGFPPAVYTRVSFFIEWIEGTLKKHGQTLNKSCD